MRADARHRLTAAVIALVLASLTLAACGKLPRPFGRDDDEAPAALANQVFFEAVQVAPLTGTTRPMGELLARAVSERLQSKYEIPAALDGLDKGRFRLDGVVAGSGPDTVLIDWRLTDRHGGQITPFRQELRASRVDWDYGSPKILNAVGEEVSAKIAHMVLGDRIVPPTRNQVAGKRGVWLPPVVGAPGDGNQSLRRAMMVALAGAGMTVGDVAGDAAFQVTGAVELGKPDKGAQTIKILWLVKDRNGRELGRASQSNAVPAGSLDGRWGQTAAFVAAAAVDGIIAVIDEAAPARPAVPDLGSGPYQPPPVRDLKTQPGRAPPPPQ